jgi:hypothetical protein
MRQLILNLAEWLLWRNLGVLSHATCSSLGIDGRDGVMLVCCRTYERKTHELYDCLLGLSRDDGTRLEDVRRAFNNVVDIACRVRYGKQSEEVVRDNFCASVWTASTDGGPTEHPGALDHPAPLLFKNLVDALRDKAHMKTCPTSHLG